MKSPVWRQKGPRSPRQLTFLAVQLHRGCHNPSSEKLTIRWWFSKKSLVNRYQSIAAGRLPRCGFWDQLWPEAHSEGKWLQSCKVVFPSVIYFHSACTELCNNS